MFTLLMLFLCVILYTMWSGKSLQLLCILTFGLLCLSAISMMFVYVGWYGGLSKKRTLCLLRMMGKWSDDGACRVDHEVILYSELDTVVSSVD